MGRGESAIGIMSEQVHRGSDGTNYCERAKSLSASSVVRLVGFRSRLLEGGQHMLEIEPPSGSIHVGRFGMDDSGGRRGSRP